MYDPMHGIKSLEEPYASKITGVLDNPEASDADRTQFHHLADTIKSGQGLCNEKLSAILCEGAVDRILEMKEWKTNWAHTNNKMIQVMAPGHSVKRCCFVDFLNQDTPI